ncbi:RBBP9/YdeN family alpha/beta hydrolase [Streptomyces sp. TRM68416]|uniref:RBBP9/YdeN family alpha/beta hydrolase n=1 Tax=Streptomyces sp. TRM68416 TaxID=2758412 RepID=UPI001661B2E5|nr:alpha/beta hydrolase [Streptomyces sp. TRM68416]MBD0844101.1 alpha/beta hydrolase [Streptomyces sp. TRM68416]
MTSYLILHGWQNHRPEGHWQHWLADRLTELGHQVSYPQLPDPDDPEPDVWLGELERHLAAGPVEVVVAHSLSAVLWLHAAARGLPGLDAVTRVLLVAPPSDAVLRSHPEVAGFAPPPLEFTLPCPTRLVAGDDDPYCEEGADRLYGDPLGLPADVLPGAGHLDPDAGYGPWPAVLDWCLDPAAGFTSGPDRRRAAARGC